MITHSHLAEGIPSSEYKLQSKHSVPLDMIKVVGSVFSVSSSLSCHVFVSHYDAMFDDEFEIN